MDNIGIFYGSSSGNTQSAAELISQGMGIDKSNIFDISRATPEQLLKYDDWVEKLKSVLM